MGCRKLEYYGREALGETTKNLEVVYAKKGMRKKKCINYYPFGMLMPERNFSANAYRYGFNGKEKDDEVAGNGNQYDYGFRIYNPRLARFLSVDPLASSYPWYTPYQFAGNKPIAAIDLDGLEERIVILYLSRGNTITTTTTVQNDGTILQKTEGVLSFATYSEISNEEWVSMKSIYHDSYKNSKENFAGGFAEYTRNWQEVESYHGPSTGTLTVVSMNGAVGVDFNPEAVDDSKPRKSVAEMFKNTQAIPLRDWARDVSMGASVVEMAAYTATVSSGGLSSEVTVPIAAGAEIVGTSADILAFSLSYLLDDKQGMIKDGVAITTTGVSQLAGKGMLKSLGDKNLDEAVEAGQNLVKKSWLRSCKINNKVMTDDEVLLVLEITAIFIFAISLYKLPKDIIVYNNKRDEGRAVGFILKVLIAEFTGVIFGCLILIRRVFIWLQ